LLGAGETVETVKEIRGSGSRTASWLPPVDSSRLDDAALVRQAQQGNVAAFEELVRHYDRAVLRLATHLMGNPEDAQDIYQETFLRVYRNLGNFRYECSFYTWLYRIVCNLCLDHLRHKRFRNREVTSELTPNGEQENPLDRVADVRPGASPEREVISREIRELVARGLARLSPKERVVFELKHYHGLKLQTVAVMFNTTENTIKNTLFRATRKLRLALAELY
jgi:RNA polymerase sigma-70 factor (ECF subfamily)